MELKFRTETETRVQWLYYGCTHKLWRIIYFAPAIKTTNNLEKSIAIKYYKNQQIVTNMKWGNDMVALFVICHMYIYLCLRSIIVVEYSDDDDDGDYTMSNSLWSFFSVDDSAAYHVLHSCLIIYKLRLTTHTYTNTPDKEIEKMSTSNRRMGKEQKRINKMPNKNQIWWYMKHKAMPISFMYEPFHPHFFLSFLFSFSLVMRASVLGTRSGIINANIR